MKTGGLSQNNPLPITSGAVWDAVQKIESGTLTAVNQNFIIGASLFRKKNSIVEGYVHYFNTNPVPQTDGEAVSRIPNGFTPSFSRPFYAYNFANRSHHLFNFNTDGTITIYGAGGSSIPLDIYLGVSYML